MPKLFLPVCLLTLALQSPVYGNDSTLPDPERMWELIQELQLEIAALKRDQALTDRKAEAAVIAVEESATLTDMNLSWENQATIGGYGELHYNNLSADDSSRDVQELDFHRFVLFVGHEFSERIRFFSEFEIEHALSKDTANGSSPGEVEIEQAYLEFDLSDKLLVRGGVFMLPVGIMNETHEPNTFYGVERNNVETVIIPATWWSAGTALSGHGNNGFSWDLAVHEGLKMPTSGADAYRVRSGRQKSSKASASDLAYSARLRYSGLPGLEIATSAVYQSDPSQIPADGLDSGLLLEAHLAYNNGVFGLRALYTQWDFGGAGIEAEGADKQHGWYIEPSIKPNDAWGFYARFEDVAGAREQDRFKQWELGANFWPHEDIVIKFDFRSRDHDFAATTARDFNGFDLGIGYQF